MLMRKKEIQNKDEKDILFTFSKLITSFGFILFCVELLVILIYVSMGNFYGALL
jgi:hypothetical protein